MNTLKHKSITHRLIKMNRVSLGVAFILLTGVLLGVEIRNFQQFEINSLSSQARIIGSNSAAAIAFKDGRAAEEILWSLRDIPNIVQGIVYTKEGEVLARYEKENALREPVSSPAEYGYDFSLRYFSLLQPIILSQEMIGSIYLRSDLKGFYTHLLVDAFLLLSSALIALFLASFLFSRLQKSITGPVTTLAEAMRTVSENQDYSVNVPVQREDEIGILAKGFNEMIDRIQQWSEELSQHRRHLEDMVAERTSQWQSANVQLQEELAERTRIEEVLREYRDELERLVQERTEELSRTNKDLEREIEEREKMEEELLRVKKLESLGILAGGIAHDFNNLLTAILGNISLAKLYVLPSDKVYQRLVDAENATMKTKDLTLQLLTFSKGGVPIKKISSVGELMKECARFVLRGSNVRCEFAVPGDLWSVEIDEGQISQVINNLVINASQSMPEGGVMAVRGENIVLSGDKQIPQLSEGKYVRITVEDHGIGILKEHLPKIFDPYFTTKQKGSGLGLATSYSIVKKHGGYIEVESEIGKGTAFSVYLPASEEKPDTEKTKEEEPLAASGRILVMDDEEMVREVAGEMLTRMGYQVWFAGDGADAVRLYERSLRKGEAFDAVIMDLTIPGGMGGKEAVGKLLEIDPRAKVIVSSGYSNDPIMADFRTYGFSGVVAKPYQIEKLSETLKSVLSGVRTSNS